MLCVLKKCSRLLGAFFVNGKNVFKEPIRLEEARVSECVFKFVAAVDEGVISLQSFQTDAELFDSLARESCRFAFL